MLLTFEEYQSYYEKNDRLPNGAYVSKKGYNLAQLQSKYKKYFVSESKREQARKRYVKKANNKRRHYKVDMKWEVTKLTVDGRDHKQCRLFKILNNKEKKDVEKQLTGVGKRIDRAHIFSKGSNPHLKYTPENIVTLYRLFHQRLDTYRHPIYDYPISADEQEKFWCRIVGENNYLQLKDLTKQSTLSIV